MTAEQFAARLTGRAYGNEITTADAAEAKRAGLVVVYGASDDLMEFEGAIYDEVGAWEGATVYVRRDGTVADEPPGACIDALWCAEPGYSWTYRTELSHATFEIVEDGEPYCRGIVFRMEDL